MKQLVELNPDMTAELNEQGEIIGIEILNVSKFLRDFVLESAQAKLLTVMRQGSHRHSRHETAFPPATNETHGLRGSDRTVNFPWTTWYRPYGLSPLGVLGRRKTL